MNGTDVSLDQRVTSILSGASNKTKLARQKIEHSLGLEGLFLCNNRESVIRLIDTIDKRHAEPASKLIIDAPDMTQQPSLAVEEQAALNALVGDLTTSSVPVVHWASPFNSGASTVVNALKGKQEIADNYDRIAFIRPSNLEFPFEKEFGELAAELEHAEGLINTRVRLVDALKRSRTLVVVLSAFCTDYAKDNSWLRQTIKELHSRAGSWDGPSALLVVGTSEWISKATGHSNRIPTERLHSLLRVRDERRFQEFLFQWKRFSDVRASFGSEASGSRMRRASTYYGNHNREVVWPISIKLRALFASSNNTYSYFDPTQGFLRLAGPRINEFPDIGQFYIDVRDFVEYYHFLDRENPTGQRGTRNYFYNVQYISTGLNWLTVDALQCLLGKIPGERQNPLKAETELKRITTNLPFVKYKPQFADGHNHGRLFLSLAVKAVVQEHWKESAPYLRSLAHYRVAERLLKHQHDKDMLGREYPYPAQWGRSRIFFLSEAVRHLVRSCEASQLEPATHAQLAANEFPEPPRPDWLGTSPIQVINYCFDIIYQRELNGNNGHQRNRHLAKRYGAYQLSVELLELMGAEQRIGLPHQELSAKSRILYLRECGYALFDVGDIEAAISCFERAIAEPADAKQYLEDLDLELDLVLVYSASGQLDAADKVLDGCFDMIGRFHKELLAEDASFAAYLALRKLYRRAIGRRAHIKYLRGDPQSAMNDLALISSEEQWKHLKERDAYPRTVLVPSFSRHLLAEQEHLRIACLRAISKSKKGSASDGDFSEALDTCLSALMRAQSSGLQHEALGFRIVFSRFLRQMKRPTAAEAVLDSVHADILRFGCSERTFLAFLNDAGKVLSELGDPLRAFATYHLPCMRRAFSKGFLREANQAASNAKRSLEMTLVEFRFLQGDLNGKDSWSQRVNSALAGHTRLISESSDSFGGSPFEKDPLYAFSVVDAEDIIKGLSEEQDFAEYFKEIENVLVGADGKRS